MADLTDMKLISNFNKGIHFLFYVIDMFSKYVVVIPLKDEKETTINNTFHKILNETSRKPNKIWVNKGCEFYNRSMKPWL